MPNGELFVWDWSIKSHFRARSGRGPKLTCCVGGDLVVVAVGRPAGAGPREMGRSDLVVASPAGRSGPGTSPQTARDGQGARTATNWLQQVQPVGTGSILFENGEDRPVGG